jgi:hypothetical protein
MDSEQRRIWLKILKRFEKRDLKSAAFALLGSGGYDNLQGRTLDEHRVSLLEALYFRNNVSELFDFIRENRPDIVKLDEFAQLESQAVKHSQSEAIEFVNRVHEIQYITNLNSPQYLIISAPAGYGKTRLLERVQFQLKSQGWLCVFVKLDRGRNYLINDIGAMILQEVAPISQQAQYDYTPEEYGYEIARQLVEKFKVFSPIGVSLYIDEVESLGQCVAQRLINELISSLVDGLNYAGYYGLSRIILSGRYVDDLQRLSNEIIWQTYSLAPFEFSVIESTTGHFTRRVRYHFSREVKQDIASYIMYLTGGHPGCVVEMLKHILPGWRPEIYFDGLYERIVQPTITEIKSHLLSELVDIFETLSVVRRFNGDLIEKFIQEGLINWDGKPSVLIDKLTKTFPITRKNGFLQDKIIRRLLAMGLLKTDFQRFIEINAKALEFYKNSLASPGVHRPDIIAVELIYQTLQYSSLGEENLVDRLDEVDLILDMLIDGRNAMGMMYSFQELLYNDWELRFYFNYLLRKKSYEERPYQDLLRIVDDFLADLRGAKND